MLHQSLLACKVAGTQVTSKVFDIQMSGVDVSAQVKLAGKCFCAVFIVAGKGFLMVALHNICMVESKPLVSMEAPYSKVPLAERQGKSQQGPKKGYKLGPLTYTQFCGFMYTKGTN